jgi:hypothetical protein
MGDLAAIVATVQDYWEGWFDGDAERMQRAVHPALAKTGVTPALPGEPGMERMTADDMIGWTRAGEGVASKPIDSAYDVVVNDNYDHIATVTVRSSIYHEYLHLVRTPDGWRIVNALYMRVRDHG